MLRKLTSWLLMLCMLLGLAIPAATAEEEKSVTYEEIVALREEIAAMEARLAEMEKQYALENANRRIVFDAPEYQVIVKKTLKVEATVERLLEDAPEKTTLVWSTSDAAVAKVDKNGKITGVAAGVAVITVTAQDDANVTAAFTVTVIQPVKKITLSEKSITLGIRETASGKVEAGTVQLTATVAPEDAYDKSIVWTSSDESVATVVDGVVTAVGKGSCKITAAAGDGSGVKATVSVKVAQAAEGVKVTTLSAEVHVGKKVTLEAVVVPEDAANKKVRWWSGDESIATVSEKGIVTGVAPGICPIYATTTDGSNLTASCRVRVIKPVTKLSVDEKTIYVKAGEERDIAVHVEPADATDPGLMVTGEGIGVEAIGISKVGGWFKAGPGGTGTVTLETVDGSNKKVTVKVVVEPTIPLVITDVRVGRNSIESPEVFLSVKNWSSNTDVIAFTFATRCYDAYGNLLKAHGFGDTTEYWIWQEGVIKAGKSWSSDWWRWTLYGFDTAYTIEVWLTDIQTSDGRTINVPKTDATTWTWSKY